MKYLFLLLVLTGCLDGPGGDFKYCTQIPSLNKNGDISYTSSCVVLTCQKTDVTSECVDNLRGCSDGKDHICGEAASWDKVKNDNKSRR